MGLSTAPEFGVVSKKIMHHKELNIDHWIEKYPLYKLNECGSAPGGINGIKPLVMNLQIQEASSFAFSKLNKVPVDIFMWRHGTPQKSYLTKIGGVPHRPQSEPWPVDSDGLPLTFLCQFCFLDSQGTLPFDVPGDVLLIFIRNEESIYDPENGFKFEWWPVDIVSSEECPETSMDIPEYQAEIFKTDHSENWPQELNEDNFEYIYTAYNISHYQGALISQTAFLDNYDLDEGENLVASLYTQLEALEDATPLDGTSQSGWSQNIEDITQEPCTIAIIRDAYGKFNLITEFD